MATPAPAAPVTGFFGKLGYYAGMAARPVVWLDDKLEFFPTAKAAKHGGRLLNVGLDVIGKVDFKANTGAGSISMAPEIGAFKESLGVMKQQLLGSAQQISQ